MSNGTRIGPAPFMISGRRHLSPGGPWRSSSFMLFKQTSAENLGKVQPPVGVAVFNIFNIFNIMTIKIDHDQHRHGVPTLCATCDFYESPGSSGIQGSFCMAFMEIGGLKPGLATVASMSNRVWPEKLSLAFERLNHWSWVSFLGPETRDAGSTIWPIQWNKWTAGTKHATICNQLEVGLNLGRKMAYVQKAVKQRPQTRSRFKAKQRHAHHAPAGHAMTSWMQSMQGGCWKKRLHPTEMWWAPLPFSALPRLVAARRAPYLFRKISATIEPRPGRGGWLQGNTSSKPLEQKKQWNWHVHHFYRDIRHSYIL